MKKAILVLIIIILLTSLLACTESQEIEETYTYNGEMVPLIETF